MMKQSASVVLLVLTAITLSEAFSFSSLRSSSIRSQYNIAPRASSFDGRIRIGRIVARSTCWRRMWRLCALPTDEEYAEWLDDMIFSGDMTGYLRRRAKDLVTEDFLGYLEERFEDSEDDDEKPVLQELIDSITSKLSSTDGMGAESGVVFEQRLDKILFTPPNQRRAAIQESMADMSSGFVEYVQNEMRATTDEDSKVVLASILQLIGQEKKLDLLGSEAALLKKADASLGDQFIAQREEGSGLVLDGSVQEGAQLTPVGEKNEQILAGLIFSQNDILEDVLNNLHYIDAAFVEFLEAKIDKTRDVDERVALSSLLGTINSVLERVRQVEEETGGIDSMNAQEREELSIDQVQQRMRDIQMGKGSSETAFVDPAKLVAGGGSRTFTVKRDKKKSFEAVLSRFQNLPEDLSLRDAVEKNYELCDYEFMDTLTKEISACDEEGASIEAQQLRDIEACVKELMLSRMGTAQERLERILGKQDPRVMMSEATLMARRGEVDEALFLLLEANIQQAKAAGAAPAVEILSKIKERITNEQERLLPDEQRLLRELLRLSDSDKRKGLIDTAFKPMRTTNQEGEIVEGNPLISPPAFINMVRNFIENYGNVDGFDIMGRAQTIIDEAQEIATELYGTGMTPQEQQKFMFEKRTLSVWDLANFEEQAMMSGEEVPWGNDKYDNMNPEEVLGERVKKIGGTEDVLDGF